MSHFPSFGFPTAGNVTRPFQSQTPNPLRGTPAEVNTPVSSPVKITSKNAELTKSQVTQARYRKNGEPKGATLDAIHSKLHEDLNNITVWKINVDRELKQQSLKLDSSYQTIESQRKSILDLQLENEKLSLRLKEELDTRREFEQRLRSTRELLFVVKEQMGKFDEKVSDCRRLKELFQDLNNERQTELNILLDKVEKLHFDYTESNNVLKVKLSEKEKDITELHLLFNTKFNNLQEQLSHSEAMNSVKAISIQDLEKKLLEMCSIKSNLESLKQQNETKISDLNIEISNKQSEMNETKIKLEVLTTELQHTQMRFDECKVDLDNAVLANKNLKNDLCSLQDRTDNEKQHLENEKRDIQEQLTVTTKKLEDVHLQLKESLSNIESLKSNSDFLKITLTDLKKQNSELQSNVKSCSTERDSLAKQVVQLESCLEDSTNVVLKQKDFEKELYETNKLLEAKTKMAATLKIDLENALEQRKFNEDFTTNLKSKVTQLEDDVLSLKVSLDEAKDENLALVEMNRNLKNEAESLARSNAETKECLELFKTDCEDLRNQLESVQHAKDVLECMLKECADDIKDLNTKLQASNNEMMEKKRYVEEIEAKFDNIMSSSSEDKNQTFKSLSSFESKINFLMEDLETSSYRIAELESKLQVSVQSEIETSTHATKLKEKVALIQNLEEDNKNLKQELAISKKQANKAEKEVEAIKFSSNNIIQAMSKSEEQNRKLYIEKEREYQRTKSHLEKLKDDLKYDKMKDEEIKQLKSKLQNKKQKYISLQKEFEEKELAWSKKEQEIRSEKLNVKQKQTLYTPNKLNLSEAQQAAAKLCEQMDVYDHQPLSGKTKPETPTTMRTPTISQCRTPTSCSALKTPSPVLSKKFLALQAQTPSSAKSTQFTPSRKSPGTVQRTRNLESKQFTPNRQSPERNSSSNSFHQVNKPTYTPTISTGSEKSCSTGSEKSWKSPGSLQHTRNPEHKQFIPNRKSPEQNSYHQGNKPAYTPTIGTGNEKSKDSPMFRTSVNFLDKVPTKKNLSSNFANTQAFTKPNQESYFSLQRNEKKLNSKPATFEFDSDTSSGSGIAVKISTAMKTLDKNCKRQDKPSTQKHSNVTKESSNRFTFSLKNKAFKSPSKMPDRDDIDIFASFGSNSLESKKLKTNAPSSRIQRKFFRRSHKETPKASKEHWVDDSSYALFND